LKEGTKTSREENLGNRGKKTVLKKIVSKKNYPPNFGEKGVVSTTRVSGWKRGISHQRGGEALYSATQGVPPPGVRKPNF